MAHQTPEQRIEAGEEFATFEDLDGLSDEALFEIADACSADADPDICVPCRAFAILMDRGGSFEPDLPDDLPGLRAHLADAEEYDEAVPTPKLDAPVQEEPVWEKPVAEQFAERVRELDVLVTEMLSGPPIPPPHVSMEDLAALVVGAERWLKVMDAQGFHLEPAQESIRQHIQSVVNRVKRHG